MCGRFTLTTMDDIVDEFDLSEMPAGFEPRYNIAPTQDAWVITNRTPRKASLFRWGLVPHWAKDLSIGNRMINARGETLADKPAFRDAYARHRCLVVADGFYEWKRRGKAKTPYYCHSRSGLIGLAGLWSSWRDDDGNRVLSFTIVTSPPNELIESLHDRMPVVIGRQDYERWLHTDPLPPEALDDLIHPAPEEVFEVFEVAPIVNSPHNDEPACIEPSELQPSLF